MADNYLERRYEDYQTKKAAWERSQKLRNLKKRISEINSSNKSDTEKKR
ncbi:MAG: hypothetical protein MJZ33_03015 [Paludibacteraceae bacterium]|nr:hypothetical protein [Paludibacteraceae bacterium]